MNIVPISLKAPELLIQAVFDGRRLGLQLFNISGMAARLSKAGAWWCPGRRMWVLEQGSADHALAWLQAHYLREHVDFDGATVLLKAAIRAPEPDYFTQLLDVQIFELARGELNHGQHAVSFSYDGLCVRAMRALQGRFHKPAAAWQVRAEVAHIQHVLRDLAGVAPEYTFVHEQPVVLEELVSANAGESPIQVPTATPEQGEIGLAKDLDGAVFLSADLEQSNAVDINEALLGAVADSGL